jgi:hypothetical protein
VAGEVGPCAEVLPLAAQDDHPDLRIARYGVERPMQLLDGRGLERVESIGAVQDDVRDTVRTVLDPHVSHSPALPRPTQ